MMKLASALVVSLAIAIPAAAHDVQTTMRTIDASGFDRIESTGPYDVDIRTGEDFSVVATGIDADLTRIDAQVDKDTLVIATVKSQGSYSTHHPTNIVVTMPTLKSANILGSGNIGINKVDDRFVALIKGSGNIDIAKVDAEQLYLVIAGSGGIRAKGRASDVNANISGSGEIDLVGLRSESAKLIVSGSGNIEADVRSDALAVSTGTGNVYVKGGANCRSASSGTGSVKCS